MIPGFGDLSAWTLAWIAGVMLVSGFVHGVIGFGFPIVGWRLHDRASVETYGRRLRGFMWVMTAVLGAQFVRAMWMRYA